MTTKSDIRSDFKYVRQLMRIIDAELTKPITPETLDELEGLANEIMAASASSLTRYIEDHREVKA